MYELVTQDENSATGIKSKQLVAFASNLCVYILICDIKTKMSRISES